MAEQQQNRGVTQATQPGRLSNRQMFFLSAMSALLSVTIFPPCGFSALAWVCLVPWLYALPRLTWRQLLLSHGVFVAIFFAIGISWMSVVHPICPFIILVPLYIMCLPFPLIYAVSVRQLGLPAVIAAPVIWTANEYLRSFLFTGFPWLYWGHSLAFMPEWIQIADITGVYGVSFLLVLTNGLVTSWLDWRFPVQTAPITDLLPAYSKWRLGRLFVYTLIAGFLVAATLAYGRYRLPQISYRYGPRIAAVQGNIPQDIKDDPRENRQKILSSYTTLSLGALGQKPDLLVWPETMSPYDPQLDAQAYSLFHDMASLSHTPLLIGSHRFALDFTNNESISYNSCYLFDDSGKISDYYDKVRLVILGEYIPKFPFLPTLMRNLVGFMPNLASGQQHKVFSLGECRFGTLICYEIVYAEDARALAKKGCHFLINITNEGWFARTCELEQILAISIFRAVENRIGIMRAGNTGITLNIPPDGRLQAEHMLTVDKSDYFASLAPFMQQRLANKKMVAWHHLPQAIWRDDVAFFTTVAEDWDFCSDKGRVKWKDFPGIFCQKVPLATGETTFYTQWGDVFARIWSMVTLVWVVVLVYQWNLRRNACPKK